ncbi:MAG: DUF4276 family protein [Myxococcota bacterium]
MNRGYAVVSARLLGNARSREQRGGIRRWDAVRKEITRHLTEDRACIASTMVDYYALPASGNGAWPGRARAAGLTVAEAAERAEVVGVALHEDIGRFMGSGFNPRRFEPFVTMHEYEGLLFSDCQNLAEGLHKPELVSRLQEIRDAFPTPEDINDSKKTAPSKRIQSLVAQVGSRYEKLVHGIDAFLEIGLPKVRAECPHFDRWVSRLEDRATVRA